MRLRYEALLSAALRDIAAKPLRAGSVARPEIGYAIRTYHLRHSRARHQSGGGVRKPRHYLLYRCLNPEITGIGRVLHDAMDIERHIPSRPTATKIVAGSAARFLRLRPLRHIPQLQRFVVAAGEREAAIGRERDGAHEVAVADELTQLGAGGSRPEL